MKALDLLINQVIQEPSLFMGLVVLLGMVFLKKKTSEILVSTIKTIVGVRLVQVAANMLVSSSKPVMDMIVIRFGLEGRVADPWTGVGESLERLAGTELLGQIGIIMISAWMLHLLLSRLTKLKVVYLTGQVLFSDTVLVTFFSYSISGWTDIRAVLIAVCLLAFYWWFWPALMKKPLKLLVGEDNITIGHNMAVFGWAAMLISKFTGNPQKDTEKLEFPEWLSFMKDQIIAYSLVMTFMYTIIGILAGPTIGSQFSQGKNYILFSSMQGINVAVAITILLFGVKMFQRELLPAFDGFAKVVVPGAVPAVDGVVFWSYAPQAALLGMIFTVFGMVAGIGLQILTRSAFITIPSVIPIFSGGSTLGVFASKYGGVRGTIIATFILGILEVIGSVWLSRVVGFQVAGGGHIDYCTYWPALLSILKGTLSFF